MAEPAGWDASAYRDVSTVQRDWGRALLARVSWRGDERVLDAGCGTGELAAELLSAHPGMEVIAIDNDRGMITAARGLLARFEDRALVLYGDAAALPEVGPVDLVFSNAVLHWIDDHDAAFASFRRVLSAGGRLLAQCGGEGNLAHARALAGEVFREAPFALHRDRVVERWHYAAAAETRGRLEAAGFEPREVSLDPAPVRFSDEASWARFLAAVPLRLHLAALPEPLRDPYLARYVERAEEVGLARRLDYVRLTIDAVARA